MAEGTETRMSWKDFIIGVFVGFFIGVYMSAVYGGAR